MKFFLPVFLSFASLPLYARHSDEFVEKKWIKVLSEIKDENARTFELPEFIKNILRFFSELGPLYQIMFVLILIALLVYFFYKIGGSFWIGEKKSLFSGNAIENSVKDSNASGSESLDEAIRLAAKGLFSKSVLMLHKGSIEFLLFNNILKNDRDYTNREIVRVLGNRKLDKPFHEIALKAEKVLFAGEESSKEETDLLIDVFRRFFHG